MNARKLITTCILVQLLSTVVSFQELKLLHVLFSHKVYAPYEDIVTNDYASIPRNLTYEYFNIAAVDMSNDAKSSMYELGAYLRKTYDKFLGDNYMPGISRTRTTEYPLSMIAGQLVNAGLWPPSKLQTWNENMGWQPTLTDYVEASKDTLLLGSTCPNFLEEVENVMKTDKIIRDALEYHFPLFRYVKDHTGMDVELPSAITRLYSTFETMVDRNISLPSWADGIFPDGEMYTVTLLEYEILSRTLLQRRLNGGTILKEILADSFLYANDNESISHKAILYSGDERNIVGVLKSMNMWSPHIPDEAAAILFELYFDNETDTYGMRIKYYTGVDDMTLALTLPDCGSEICPLEKFSSIVFDVIPLNEESLCGRSSSDHSVSNGTVNPSNSTDYHNDDNSTKHSGNDALLVHRKILFILLLFTQYSTLRMI